MIIRRIYLTPTTYIACFHTTGFEQHYLPDENHALWRSTQQACILQRVPDYQQNLQSALPTRLAEQHPSIMAVVLCSCTLMRLIGMLCIDVLSVKCYTNRLAIILNDLKKNTWFQQDWARALHQNYNRQTMHWLFITRLMITLRVVSGKLMPWQYHYDKVLKLVRTVLRFLNYWHLTYLFTQESLLFNWSGSNTGHNIKNRASTRGSHRGTKLAHRVFTEIRLRRWLT